MTGAARWRKRHARPPASGRARVVVVGPSFRFTSGLSVYTHRLAGALGADFEVSGLLLRRLVPKWLFPGQVRVGKPVSALTWEGTAHFDGIDWYLLPSIVRGLRFVRSRSPGVMVLEWWTVGTLATYVLLAVFSKLAGIKVILELHEIQDPGEAALPLLPVVARLGLGALLRLSDGAVVHSRSDLEALRAVVDVRGLDVRTIAHGPYDHLVTSCSEQVRRVAPSPEPLHSSPPLEVLFFGLIRPYKGLEDLVEAFNGLSPEEASRLRLTLVGETWERWTLPAELVAASPHRSRITFVNRYVTEEELARYLEGSDVVVLPYRRATSSGPLHMAMSHGLTAVIYDIPALLESAGTYAGTVVIPRGDVAALRRALVDLTDRPRRRYQSVHSWDVVRSEYGALLQDVLNGG